MTCQSATAAYGSSSNWMLFSSCWITTGYVALMISIAVYYIFRLFILLGYRRLCRRHSHGSLAKMMDNNGYLHRVSKNCAKLFCHNFLKFPPTVKLFGTMMAKTISLCGMQSFSTSPNLCWCTTVLNTYVTNWNCYIMPIYYYLFQ